MGCSVETVIYKTRKPAKSVEAATASNTMKAQLPTSYVSRFLLSNCLSTQRMSSVFPNSHHTHSLKSKPHAHSYLCCINLVRLVSSNEPPITKRALLTHTLLYFLSLSRLNTTVLVTGNLVRPIIGRPNMYIMEKIIFRVTSVTLWTDRVFSLEI